MTAHQRTDIDQWTVDEGEIELDGAVTSVDVRVPGGSITVAVCDGPPRVVVADTRRGPVTVTIAGGELTVRQPGREGVDALGDMLESFLGALGMGGDRGRRASVTVLLPTPVPTMARSVTAEVMFSGLDDASADTVSGEVTVSRLRRSLRVNTVSGAVWTADIDGSVSLKTVSAPATVARGRLDELRIQTVSGDVAVDAALGSGSHGFQSVSGDLALRADFPAGFALDATTVSGRVVCGIGDPQEVVRPGARRVTAGLGAGGARLGTRTVSGDVTLLPRTGPGEVA
jgi:putative adhesin